MWNRHYAPNPPTGKNSTPTGVRRPVISLLGGVLSVVALILLWETGAVSGIISTEILPAPHQIAAATWDLLRDGSLQRDLFQSLQRVLAGFCVALIFGIPLGLLSGMSRIPRFLLLPIVNLTRPIPPIAWVPLAILWFGLGDHSSYFIVFLGAFGPIFINTFYGVQSVDRQHVNVARCLGANRWRILKEVVLPSALPAILTGARVGSGVAWTSVIAAELIGAQDGLGYMIQMNRLMLQTDNLLAGMVTIGLAGATINGVLTWLQIRLIPWKRDNPLQAR